MRILGFDLSISRDSVTPADLLIKEQSRNAEERASGTDLSEIGWTSLGSYGTSSGESISEERAMRLATVYSAVRIIAETTAALPLKTYRRDGRNRVVLQDHPLTPIFQRQANMVMTAMDYRELMLVHLLLWGNHFSEIIRNGAGDVVELWPIHPARVIMRARRRRNKRVYLEYDVVRDRGGMDTLPAEKIFHVRGLGFDGVRGKSPIRLHRETLGVDSAAQKFGARFFKNDARLGVFLATDQVLDDDVYERLKKDWLQDGGSAKAWETKILEAGLKAETLTMPPKDAQFLEARKFSRQETAAIYRVPLHMMGDLERATFSNIEHQGIEFVVHTLRPWMVRIEQAASMQLLTENERDIYISHLVDGLLRGDQKSRYEAYSIGRQWGWLSANDILEMEDQNGIGPAGDIYLTPMNMIPAGGDPLAASNAEVQFNGARRSRPALPAETRALPSRYNTARAIETVYRDQLRRVVKREIVEIRNNLGDLENENLSTWGNWLFDFEADHADWMRSRVSPMFRAMAESMVAAAQDEVADGDQEAVTIADIERFVEEYTDTYTRRYTGSSRGQLLSLINEDGDDTPIERVEARLDDWEETRADQEARRERQRSSNAFTRAAWAVAGVATVTWTNVGSENCPICEEMDGVTSVISSTFVTPGDQVADLDVSRSVAHPPIHDGCDCILTPGVGARNQLTPAELRGALDILLETEASELLDHQHIHTNGHSHG